jgi:fructokinase
MFAMVDVVKVSDEDLAWITGADDLDAGAADLLDKGVKLVCVTRGAEGATGITKGFSVAVPARKAHVVDTVGAGDTFNAGVLASLHEKGVLTRERIASLDEETVKAALSLGAQAAAVTVSRAGANPPRRHEIA